MCQGKRVLIVDDNFINRDIIGTILQAEGIETEEAEDGQEAVTMATAACEGWYDLIIMDILMPGMDGYETARQIRALDRTDVKTVPILAMSADASEEDVRRSFAAGMNAHLEKPLSAAQLRDIMRKWLTPGEECL